MKTIIVELDLLKKIVIIQSVRKKDLLLFATKFNEKIPDPNKPKEYYQPYLEKIDKTIKNNCSTTKIYRKPKHC